MAPALTKILKDGHGIHLSSPPAFVRMDSDGRAMHSAELESQRRSTDDGDLQKMWLNLSPFPPLDSCLPVSPLDVPSNSVLSPCLQATASQGETLLLPSPDYLLKLLSIGKGLRDSHQAASIFPGVPDMFLVPVPEHNSQEACLLQGNSAPPECGPDGGDVHHSTLAFTFVPPSYSQGEKKHQGYTPVFVPPLTLTREKVVEMGCPALSSVNSDQLAFRVVLEEAVKEQISRQAGLQSRAQRLQRRLQSLLGEHASLHCSQQLEGLKRHCHLGGVSHDSLDSIHPHLLPPQAGCSPRFPWLDSSTASPSLTELREFSRSSQAVLRGLQEALDSEATASSSSDEEQEEDTRHGKTKTSPLSGSCERRWLEERAELGSRWSWLQLRLVKLEGSIQQLVELHKHIRSTKGGVVLAESQPLTDRQIQQTLLKEMAGLSCTAADADADTEPCSPTSLLHNIERQSAQLSQIVNSLMPPLSFSPLSKQPHTCKGKRAFTSGQREDDAVVPGCSKRRKLGTRRLFKADVSCVCARTRPLATYHKPKLFTLSTYSSSSLQDSGKFTSTLSSSLSSSSCSCCSSCDPVVVCSDPDCHSSRALSSRTFSSRPHSVLGLSFDPPLSHHLQGNQGREVWSQRPLVFSIQPSSPACYNRHSSTPLHNSHKYKQHSQHHKSRVMGLSPIRMAGSTRSQHRRANRRKQKRRHTQRLTEDVEDVLYQLHDTEDSSDEVVEERYTQVTRKQVSQGFVRKRQGESVYNINNVVIPMSVTKVEKLQYKDILTPSWRVVDVSPLMNREAERVEDSEGGQVEDVSDEAFAQRHLALEQREKLRWGSWGKRKCCGRPKRSGSRLSGSGGGMCTSGEESSVELSCAQLDTDEQQSSEEWLPQTPWEQRMFPLDEDDEDALLSDNLQKVPSGWSDYSSAATTSKNSNSQLSPAQFTGATLPPGGQSKSTSPDGS